MWLVIPHLFLYVCVVCVYSLVWVCACLWVCAPGWVYMHVVVRLVSCVFLYCSPPLCRRSLPEPLAHRVAGQWAAGIFLSLYPPCWDCRHALPLPVVVGWLVFQKILGTWAHVLMLCSRHLTDWDFSHNPLGLVFTVTCICRMHMQSMHLTLWKSITLYVNPNCFLSVFYCWGSALFLHVSVTHFFTAV